MSTISNANVRATKATGARAKKESGKTPDSSAPYALKLPNKESLSALANVAAGNVKRTYSMEELKADLENSDD